MYGYFSPQQNVNASAVFQAIHVENSTKSPTFQMVNSDVSGNLSYAAMWDGAIEIEDLLNRTTCDGKDGTSVPCSIGVLVYGGEFDAVNGPFGQEVWLKELNFDGMEDFWNQSRQIYW